MLLSYDMHCIHFESLLNIYTASSCRDQPQHCFQLRLGPTLTLSSWVTNVTCSVGSCLSFTCLPWHSCWSTCLSLWSMMLIRRSVRTKPNTATIRRWWTISGIYSWTSGTRSCQQVTLWLIPVSYWYAYNMHITSNLIKLVGTRVSWTPQVSITPDN